MPALRRPTVTAAKGGAKGKSPRLGTDTRERLLDAAERLFADHGYDGTSLRDIADLAGQNMALSTYHFGTKLRLFEEVVRRRAVELEAARLAALARVGTGAAPRAEVVRALIEAYAVPVIDACYGPSKQWQSHVRLISQLVSVKRWTPLLRSHYDHCGQIFLDRFREAMPDADPNALLDAFSFMVATILYVCSYTNRFDRMRTGTRSPEDEISSVTENCLRFVHAGFMAL
ncbi:TetR/AcrR family transcriptional regulator [Rhizorhabdus dicambivorans]|uniref:TetR/AcrR family transcriptional regulator n=1 Tax=Rhizorhabdus dicambivorans TaxID=1850238 RepID=UPI000AA43CF8|nr:TetR/AcrR family transcriptional regulator [Rhizorhabdus dicambivorans]